MSLLNGVSNSFDSFSFLWQATGKVEKAREVPDEAPEHVQLSKPFLEVLLAALSPYS